MGILWGLWGSDGTYLNVKWLKNKSLQQSKRKSNKINKFQFPKGITRPHQHHFNNDHHMCNHSRVWGYIERNSSYKQIEMSVVSSDDDNGYCYIKTLKTISFSSRLFTKVFKFFFMSLHAHETYRIEYRRLWVSLENENWIGKLDVFCWKAYMRVAWNSQKQWMESDNLFYFFFRHDDTRIFINFWGNWKHNFMYSFVHS